MLLVCVREDLKMLEDRKREGHRDALFLLYFGAIAGRQLISVREISALENLLIKRTSAVHSVLW